uniref:Enoyl reductase (ER) domain-containing protein n=1 Tax=Proboscia inermis TaxID=420281 RepID=A0A7S0BXN1_9STRA|mmetsp:Transcript_14892/g.15072  ORF Transcript_14892/g.15072 Transcript_14892/m.15072 type:complete len:330 (+) Transcript_14892:91-1080(+)
MKKDGTPVPNHRSPFIVGYGGSGVIKNIGKDCCKAAVDNNLSIGKKVAFLGDANRNGSYASHILVDYRLVVPLDDEVNLAEAATVPLAGCTAYESLEKVGLKIGFSPSTEEGNPVTTTGLGKTLLIVGGSGGVGSWTTLLASALYPDLRIICTTSSPESREWCLKLGATSTIDHGSVNDLGGGRNGSVDYIICLSEPTKELFGSLAEVVKPLGKICLVVAGDGIKSLDMSFIFFKSCTVCTETVFSSCRSGFILNQKDQIGQIFSLFSLGKIKFFPLAPGWKGIAGTLDWKSALQDGGVMDVLSSGHCRGKLVMKIAEDKDLDHVDTVT